MDELDGGLVEANDLGVAWGFDLGTVFKERAQQTPCKIAYRSKSPHHVEVVRVSQVVVPLIHHPFPPSRSDLISSQSR